MLIPPLFLQVWRETDMVMKDIKWSEQAAMRTFDLLEDAFYKVGHARAGVAAET